MRWRLMLVGIACMVGALANWNDTLTGIDLEKLPHPPLIKIWSGPLKDGARATFDGITAEADRSPREVRLHSAGKSGKAWEVHMCCLDEVWRADLDGNGTPDYIFFSNGPYFNGRTTPLFSMSILLMDSQGLPVPFFTVVYQGENGGGTNGLVDLDHDGRAELLISTYDEAVSDPHAGVFSSGHWVTQLYRFRNLRVEEFRGTMGGLTFPFVHAWTYRGREGAATGNPLPSSHRFFTNMVRAPTGKSAPSFVVRKTLGWTSIRCRVAEPSSLGRLYTIATGCGRSPS